MLGILFLVGDWNATTQEGQSGTGYAKQLVCPTLVKAEKEGKIVDLWAQEGKPEGRQGWTRKQEGRAAGGSRLDRIMVSGTTRGRIVTDRLERAEQTWSWSDHAWVFWQGWVEGWGVTMGEWTGKRREGISTKGWKTEQKEEWQRWCEKDMEKQLPDEGTAQERWDAMLEAMREKGRRMAKGEKEWPQRIKKEIKRAMQEGEREKIVKWELKWDRWVEKQVEKRGRAKGGKEMSLLREPAGEQGEEVWRMGKEARRYVDRVQHQGQGQGAGLQWKETRAPLTAEEEKWLDRTPGLQEVVGQLKKRGKKGKSGGKQGVCA